MLTHALTHPLTLTHSPNHLLTHPLPHHETCACTTRPPLAGADLQPRRQAVPGGLAANMESVQQHPHASRGLSVCLSKPLSIEMAKFLRCSVACPPSYVCLTTTLFFKFNPCECLQLVFDSLRPIFSLYSFLSTFFIMSLLAVFTSFHFMF